MTDTKEWDYKVVDVSTNSVTVNDAPTLLKGVYINLTLSNHIVDLMDGTADVARIPANATAGNYYDFEGVRLLTSFIVDPDDSAEGNITVFYRSLEYD